MSTSVLHLSLDEILGIGADHGQCGGMCDTGMLYFLGKTWLCIFERYLLPRKSEDPSVQISPSCWNNNNKIHKLKKRSRHATHCLSKYIRQELWVWADRSRGYHFRIVPAGIGYKLNRTFDLDMKQ